MSACSQKRSSVQQTSVGVSLTEGCVPRNQTAWLGSKWDCDLWFPVCVITFPCLFQYLRSDSVPSLRSLRIFLSIAGLFKNQPNKPTPSKYQCFSLFRSLDIGIMLMIPVPKETIPNWEFSSNSLNWVFREIQRTVVSLRGIVTAEIVVLRLLVFQSRQYGS